VHDDLQNGGMKSFFVRVSTGTRYGDKFRVIESATIHRTISYTVLLSFPLIIIIIIKLTKLHSTDSVLRHC
jgi:hypothetical protein